MSLWLSWWKSWITWTYREVKLVKYCFWTRSFPWTFLKIHKSRNSKFSRSKPGFHFLKSIFEPEIVVIRMSSFWISLSTFAIWNRILLCGLCQLVEHGGIPCPYTVQIVLIFSSGAETDELGKLYISKYSNFVFIQ